jgi:hypothetical protein
MVAPQAEKDICRSEIQKMINRERWNMSQQGEITLGDWKRATARELGIRLNLFKMSVKQCRCS